MSFLGADSTFFLLCIEGWVFPSCFLVMTTFKNKITRFGMETLPSIQCSSPYLQSCLVSSHLSQSHLTLALLLARPLRPLSRIYACVEMILVTK